MNLSERSHEELLGMIRAAHEAGLQKSDMAARLLEGTLRPSFNDAHSHTAAPTLYNAFDTVAGAGTGQLISTVGTDLTLFAGVGTGVEAGLIIIDAAASKIEVFAAGAGGTCGWAVRSVDWGTSAPGTFTSTYNATPGPGYGARGVFAHDLRGHAYKPLHDMAVKGGQITCRLVMRPWGPAGSVVPWPGAFLTAISSAACQMLQDTLEEWQPANYGPIGIRRLYKGGDKEKPGPRTTVRGLLGSGKIADVFGSLKGLIMGTDPARSIPR